MDFCYVRRENQNELSRFEGTRPRHDELDFLTGQLDKGQGYFSLARWRWLFQLVFKLKINSHIWSTKELLSLELGQRPEACDSAIYSIQGSLEKY